MLTRPAALSSRVANLLRKQNHGVNTRARFKFSTTAICSSKLQVGDRVLLTWKQGKSSKRKLTKPLREDGETVVDSHPIKHKDILGRDPDIRLLSTSKSGLRKLSLFARHPNLDEFTSLAPRRVAPIYATYASTIVSLLDIHVGDPSLENDPQSRGTGPTFQILEAGTGHGSLTLHLARAIAAANPPASSDIKPKPSAKTVYKAGEEVDAHAEFVPNEALAAWQKQRRAVLHTVDIDPLNREHADKLIRSFRNAIYWPHIDFYAGNVKDWVAERLDNSPEKMPFLDIVVLDMPAVEEQFSSTVRAIKNGGQLLVFAPQITQIAACVQEVTAKELGLKLEKVVELGDGISNGRLWDVRMATLKNARLSKFTEDTVQNNEDVEVSAAAIPNDPVEEATTSSPVSIPPMVCRPMVGELTRGGGFVGLWRKKATSTEPICVGQ